MAILMFKKGATMLFPYSGILCRRIGTETENKNGVKRTSSNKEKPLEVIILSSAVENVKKNEKYLIARFSGMEFEYENEDYVYITPEDIIAGVQ